MVWRLFQAIVIVSVIWMYHEISIEDGTQEQAGLAFLIGLFVAWVLTTLLTRAAELVLRLWARLRAPRRRPAHIAQPEGQICSPPATDRFPGELLQYLPRRRIG